MPISRPGSLDSVAGMLEPLERRALLSVSLSPEGSLTVLGGAHSDRITIYLSSTNSNRLHVKLDGQVRAFDIGKISNILVKGRGGNDRITIDQSNGAIMLPSRIYGEQGNDTIIGGSGRDRISGGSGDDLLWGGNGRDIIYGESGDDEISGGNHDDMLDGGDGDDDLSGGRGRDMIRGGNGNDHCCGDADEDSVFGGNGFDEFESTDSGDELEDRDARDQVNGEDHQHEHEHEGENDDDHDDGGDQNEDGD